MKVNFESTSHGQVKVKLIAEHNNEDPHSLRMLAELLIEKNINYEAQTKENKDELEVLCIFAIPR